MARDPDLQGLSPRGAPLPWLAAAVMLVLATPAFAQAPAGGAGGYGQTNGGTSSATGLGGIGSTPGNPIGGGGGGGAGTTGGYGGTDYGNDAVAGHPGQGAGDKGGAGGYGGFDGGGGGGGGNHGAVITSDGTNSGTITGGDGGPGGSSAGSNTSGGGGGAAGYGVVLDGSGLIYTNNGTIGGGTGGAGGAETFDGYGGYGGDGGYGVYVTGAGTLTNTGSITGGAGGAGGSGTNGSSHADGNGGNGSAGVYFGGTSTLVNSGSITGGDGGTKVNLGSISSTPGTAGAGVVGADLAIINSGAISGGLGGDGVTRSNAITFTGGSNVLELQAGYSITGNVVGTGSDMLRLGGATASSFDVSSIGASAQYEGFSTFIKAGLSTWTLMGTTTAVTPWIINQGTLDVSADAALGASSGAVTLDPGTTLHLEGVQIANTVNVSGDPNIVVTGANSLNTIAGSGVVNILGTSGSAAIDVLTLNGPNAYTAATFVGDGTTGAAATLRGGAANALSANSATTVTANSILDLGGFDQIIGSLAGAGTVTNNGASGATLTTNGDNSSTIFSGVIQDGSASTALTKTGAGALTLSGINSYTGATTINAGTLVVDGSIADSSSVTVNSGGTLSGTGIVDPATTTIMSGGTLAPGSAASPTGTLSISGNLAFQSGALYLVQVTPSSASTTNVSGSATLGGATVNAVFANGSYIAKQYTVLSATGGVSGSFAPGVVNTNLPEDFETSLSYDATHAYLDLSLIFVPPPGSGLNQNQQAVGSAITNFFNSTGSIPLVFGGLTPSGLTQASGELGTAAQQTTFDAMSQFMGLLTDPFIQRDGGLGSALGAAGFADHDGTSAYAANKRNDAFAMFTKAPPRASFAQRWSVWTAGFGGSQSTGGNAVVGSNDTTSRIAGAAVGADYLFSADTLAGFALAGGGTNFGVNALGSGRSDLFQAGAYLRHREGPAYISAALAYGWQDITTDRTVTISGVDHLRAEFNANAWSGRLEGGYRFVAPLTGGIGLTPYGAAQFTTFDLPAYTEQAISGTSAFALDYAAKNVTDTRSELGLRSDKSFALPDGILTLRSRLAWAHDFNPDRSIAATFQALPGATFVVNGAAQAPDSALTTASLEMNWMNGWSAGATFEGEFSDVTRSYAGRGTLRYVW